MDKLYVPKQLKVGYNERNDTYSKKLAYVIYFDDKGKLRKETSWRNWIEDELGEDDFENVPTSGFVLNRAVGGVKRSWYHDARMEKVRVFDPRGFEIEIDMDNLLFILQENSSIVGKGLEGEFVYAWEGTNLVLLPTNCTEYEDAKNYTALQGKKITKADIVEGCSYTTKKGQKLVYLGRFDFTHYKYSYNGNSCVQTLKKHIFYNLDYMPEPSRDDDSPETEAEWDRYYDNEFSHNQIVVESGFTKLALRNTEEPVGNYAELVEIYAQTPNSSIASHIEWEPVTLPEFPKIEETVDNYRNSWIRQSALNNSLVGLFIRLNKKDWNTVSFDEEWDYKGYDYSTHTYKNLKFKGYEFNGSCTYSFDNITKGVSRDWNRTSNNKCYTREQLESIEFYKVWVVLENGAKIPMDTYYDKLRENV